jgi:hypothetical protein
MIENPYYPRSASLPSFTTYPMSIMSTLVNSEQKPSSCRGQRHHGSCDHQIRETTSPQIILNEFGCCVKSFLSKNMTFPAWYFLRIPVISEVTSRKHGKEGDLCTAQIHKVYLPLRARTFDQEIVYFLVQDGVNCLLRYAYFIYRVQSPLRHTGNEDGMYRRRSHPSHPADDFF